MRDLVRCATAVALTLLALPLPRPAHAQTAADALPPEVWRALRTADRVRFTLEDGDHVETNRIGTVNDRFVLSNGRTLGLHDIAAIEALGARSEPYARHGAWMGALAGLGAGIAVASDETSLQRRVGTTALVAVGGAALGAVVGAVVGSRRHETRLRYNVPPPGAAPPPGGLVEYRRGPSIGSIRSRLAITPYVAFGGYSDRTAILPRPDIDIHVRFGLSRTQGAGIQAQYALGPRLVLRGEAALMRGGVRYHIDGAEGILAPEFWLARAGLGLELRMRANVPGYFVVTGDGLYNPRGYLLQFRELPDDPDRFRLEPAGLDAGVIPRVGIGAGFDIFLEDDRRLRMEWIYRVGLYSSADVEEAGFDPVGFTRDATFTVGAHVPLVRPDGS